MKLMLKTMQIKFISYSKDYLRFKPEYDKVWEDVNMRGDLILRKDVEEFEERLAKYVGTKYAVALSSGTDAIFLALKALGVKGKVALPSLTFKATCGAVLDAGCEPVIYDLDGHIEEFPDACIPVHIAGELSNTITEIPVVIEDACQALGAVKNPTSNVQCWSFYPAKILGCKGDAGAITTNDKDVYEYVKEFRNHFKNDNRDFGGNYRMDNLQAALLNVKIQHIDEILQTRKDIAERYLEQLSGIDKLKLPNNSNGRVWQDFVVYVGKDRDKLYDFLKAEGVETMKNEYPFSPEYPKPPQTADFEAGSLRIPCNENLEWEEVDYVISKIKQFYGN